jgi:phosphoglycolate phosphatase
VSEARTEYKFVVFDLDGTLIDSRRDIADAANALLVQCGAPALPEEQIGRMVGDGAATLVARAFEAAGLPRPADALARFLEIYDTHLTDHTQPYAGIPATLAALHRRMAMGVLTNKPLRATETILHRLNLEEYFGPQLVIGGDEAWPRKPEPGGLRELMARAGVGAGQTLLVGDSPIDWGTARAAGTAICVARYGFGFEAFSRDALAAADHLVESPAGILRLFEITTF